MFEYKETGLCTGRGFSGTDANGFLAKFYTWITKTPAGPGWFMWDDQSALATNPYIVVCDVETPVVNDLTTGQSGGPPKFLRVVLPTPDAGRVTIMAYTWWNNATHVGYGYFMYDSLTTYDSAEFQYFFVGGTEGMFIGTRTGSTYTFTQWDEWDGDANLVEGPDAVGVLDGAVSAGSDVVLQLHAGEAANFTEDNWYFIQDYDEHSWINYVQVTNVDLVNHRITVGAITNAYPDGAIIGAYIHRWCFSSDVGTRHCIPYYSSVANPRDTGTTLYGRAGWVFADHLITRLAPDDNGQHAVMRPLVAENIRPTSSSTTEMNRAYGVLKNSYVTLLGSMLRAQDGRVINGANWLYYVRADDWGTAFSSTSSYAVLTPDPS